MADRKRVADRSTTPARKRKGPVDATARRALRWKGEVERFSAVREGGPGRPQTLFALLLAGGLLVAAGVWYIGKSPDGSGPVMILLGAWALLSLAFWVLVKAGLRSTQVTFVIDRRGVHIRPSTAQRKLDRRMRGLMLLVFWLSLKGGQWAAWSPMTAWRVIRFMVPPKGYRLLFIACLWLANRRRFEPPARRLRHPATQALRPAP